MSDVMISVKEVVRPLGREALEAMIEDIGYFRGAALTALRVAAEQELERIAEEDRLEKECYEE